MDQSSRRRRVHFSLHPLTLESLDKLAATAERTRSEMVAWLIDEERWRRQAQIDPRDP
jgi:hypothetical protein